MNVLNPTGPCPHCGLAIPADAPGGLCPRCVMGGAATPTDAGNRTGGRTPPPLAEVSAAFPNLQILGLLGSGGMGFVYHVRQAAPAREAALKILPASLATDPTFVERFNRECRTLARLNHPNIVRVYESGQSGGLCYLLMELVDGANLRQAMRAGRFSPDQALAVIPRICDALQYAHSQGVLHRDIKPENILLDAEGAVKIADFGIAKMVGAGGGPDVTLTGTGLRLGTPHYMAPEQIEHPGEVDHRADIYSLGVVFYELLTGELPLGRFPAPSTKAYLDARVDEIVFRALAKERELRQQTAGEVRSQVEDLGRAPAAPDPAEGAPLRVSTAYLSTPEHLRSAAGLAYIYTGKGELALRADRLTHHGSTAAPLVIPLRAIRGLSLGEYPRFAKPTGLNYIAVAFEEHGALRTVLFTPYQSMWNPTWSTNRITKEWMQALRDRVTATVGRAPAEVPATTLAGPTLGTLLASMAIPALCCALAAAAALWGPPLVRWFNSRQPLGEMAAVLLGLVSAAAAVGLTVWARRGRKRAGLWTVGALAVGVAAIAPLVGIAVLRTFLRSRDLPLQAPHPTGWVRAAFGVVQRSPDVSMPSPPELSVSWPSNFPTNRFILQRTGVRELSPAAVMIWWRLWSPTPAWASITGPGRSDQPLAWFALDQDVKNPSRSVPIQLRCEAAPEGGGINVAIITAGGAAASFFLAGDPEALLSQARLPLPEDAAAGRIEGVFGRAAPFLFTLQVQVEARVDARAR